MKFTIKSLTIYFRNGQEVIPFSRLSYYYGKVGAGKSSIAKLIDYCLGSDFQLTPALQQGFVGAKLMVELKGGTLSIDRQWSSSNIRSSWFPNEAPHEGIFQLVSPRKTGKADNSENISDLIFRLSGATKVKVSKSKVGINTELTTISLRDLLWYCYIDQQEMDSNFFNLRGVSPWIVNKSADVLRLVLNMHNSLIQSLEQDLDRIKKARVEKENLVRSLQIVLTETRVGDTNEIIATIQQLERQSAALSIEIEQEQLVLKKKTVSGATEALRSACRDIAFTISELEKNIDGLRTKLDNDTKQLNEITGLSLKFDRASSAKSILANVDYKSCPRCTQQLPERAPDCCIVCGQLEPVANAPEDFNSARADIDSRTSELKEINSIHQENIENLQSRRKALVNELYSRENELNTALTEYDSAYLSTIILKQKQLGANGQHIVHLSQLLSIARKVDENKLSIGVLKVQEADLRSSIKEAKASDNGENTLRRLQKYFLQCLVNADFPGLSNNTQVTISPKDFLPTVTDAPFSGGAEPTEATFDNVSSGGKMSIFKACFAIAIHRIALESDSLLPNFLIIDSPMKNISERENRDLFIGFYNMLYDLAAHDMRTTQFILIDKELVEPTQQSLLLDFTSRHMTPDNPDYPPLIRDYQKRL